MTDGFDKSADDLTKTLKILEIRNQIDTIRSKAKPSPEDQEELARLQARLKVLTGQ